MSDHTKLNYTYEKLAELTNIAQIFSKHFLKYMSAPRAYLLPSGITTREVYILVIIAERPGIVTVEIAKLWDVTPGAITQVLTKLERKGFIERRKEEGNAKEVHLYATEKGKALAKEHKDYNQGRFSKLEQEVFNKYSVEEIEVFYEIMKDLNEFYA